MNKIEVFPKTTLRISRHNRRAVSDVVAVLILIVIAIIGAVAVGLILSNASHSVGSQAASNGNGQSAATELLIGGSTTIYPVTQAATPSFEQLYHANLVDAQGGSGAGMQGVISGALDIGAASSSSAVYQGVTYIQDQSITGVTLTPTLIGGSAVVVVMNAGSGAPLTDGTNTCVAITKAALAKIFTVAGTQTGYFTITAGTGCTTGILDAGAVTNNVAAATPHAIQAVSRVDLPSGTEDTFSSYIGTGSSAPAAGYDGFQAVGNPGVLAQVQKAPGTNNPGGSIGFVDLGFAEGAATGTSCTTASGTACGVFIPEIESTAAAATPYAQGCTAASTALAPAGAGATTVAGAANCFAGVGQSTGNLHSFVKAALLNYATINPTQVANPTFAPGQTEFPDSGGSLARSFYYVTNGTPTPLEQEFLTYMTSPSATVQAFFHNNGYFTVYDFTGA